MWNALFWKAWLEHLICTSGTCLMGRPFQGYIAFCLKTQDLAFVSTGLSMLMSLLNWPWYCLLQERVKRPIFNNIKKTTSNSYGYIANLCVTKSARRQGVARNMLQFAVKSAKLQGEMKMKHFMLNCFLGLQKCLICCRWIKTYESPSWSFLFLYRRCRTGICACGEKEQKCTGAVRKDGISGITISVVQH